MATIGAHYVMSALRGAEKKGVDIPALLKQAKIQQALLSNPKARFDVERMARLYAGAAIALNDEFMGFTEHPLKVGTFALMAEWVSSSRNLEELLRKGMRFYNQITNDVEMSLQVEGEHVYFTSKFHRPELDPEHFYIEYWHVVWHRFASWYIGQPIKLLGAYINYQPVDGDEFKLLFRCQTHLNSRYNRLVFHQRYLSMPLIKTRSELGVFLRRAPIDLLTIPGEDNSLSARILQKLEPKHFPESSTLELPSAQALAKEFRMSEQTLRRKLNHEGMSYQQIKDQLRLNLAKKLLSHHTMPIAEVSRALNFSEPRALSRAFLQWTGHSPSAYRRHKQQLTQSLAP